MHRIFKCFSYNDCDHHPARDVFTVSYDNLLSKWIFYSIANFNVFIKHYAISESDIESFAGGNDIKHQDTNSHCVSDHKHDNYVDCFAESYIVSKSRGDAFAYNDDVEFSWWIFHTVTHINVIIKHYAISESDIESFADRDNIVHQDTDLLCVTDHKQDNYVDCVTESYLVSKSRGDAFVYNNDVEFS